MIYTSGQILDICSTTLQLGEPAAIQIHRLSALLEAATALRQPAESAVAVQAWIETQRGGDYTPPPAPFPLQPTIPAIIWHHDADAPLERLRTLLAWRYPLDHPLNALVLDAHGTLIKTMPITLGQVSSPILAQQPFILYVPSLSIAADRRSSEGLHWVVSRLLGPGGCPWDVKQTHQSLRGNLLEETYEVLEALDSEDMHGMAEELGDLLISIFVHSEMARQAGAFNIADVLDHVTSKLIRRHPHVFGALALDNEGHVQQNWEEIKAAELAEKGRSRSSVLDGVPPTLPALATAQKLGKKAARVGFAWRDATDAWAKLHEELNELALAVESNDHRHINEEMGDLLFIVARLASYLGIDAEAALREANLKFRRRFTFIETSAANEGREMTALSLDEMIMRWNQAKQTV